MAPPWKLAKNSITGKVPKITDFQNTAGKVKYQKYFEDNDLFGYYVTAGGRGSAPSVRPIYRGTLMLKPAEGKDKDIMYVFEIHTIGDRLSGFSFDEDPEGAALANIAATALASLESRMHGKKRMDKQVAQLANKFGVRIKPKKGKKDAAQQDRVRPSRRRK